MVKFQGLKLAAVCAALAVAACGWSQTASFVKSIDVSSVSSVPTGIDVYNGDVYFVNFNSKTLVKIASPLSASPVLSTMQDFSTVQTWPTGRGLSGCNIDPANGDIYVAGDGGSAAAGFFARVTNANVVNKQYVGFPQRINSMAKWIAAGDTGISGYVVTSSLTSYNLAGSPAVEISTTSLLAAPYNGNVRDVAVDYTGKKVYYSRNGTTADGYAQVDVSGASTIGDLTGLTSTGIYQTTGTNTIGALGVGFYKSGSNDYLIVPDISGYAVRLVDPVTKTVKLSVENNVGSGIRDAAIGNIGGTDYLFVTKMGAAPPTGDSILVYQLSGLAGVNDWDIY